jgi:hypothetical protein
MIIEACPNCYPATFAFPATYADTLLQLTTGIFAKLRPFRIKAGRAAFAAIRICRESCPSVLIQSTAIKVSFVLTIFKERAEDIFLLLADACQI